MPGIKEIKNRIKSVGDTQKITGAMYLVASAKLSGAKSTVLSHRAYANECSLILSSALAHSPGSVYTQDNGADTQAVLVIGSDRGLCGDYNKNIAKFASQKIKELKNPKVYVSGGRVKSLLTASGIVCEEDFDIAVKKPDNGTACEIADYFMNLFTGGAVSSFSVIFADFADKSRLCVKKLLPFEADEEESERGYDFLPDTATLLDTLIPVSFRSSVRSCILSAFCSEQNTRMMAMKNANDNAGDLLAELRLEYNHTRQNAITEEIADVSGERKIT